MSKYRRIATRTWIDKRFQLLSKAEPNAQTLWFYLLSCPETTTFPGLFVLSIASTAEFFEWDYSETLKCWKEIENTSGEHPMMEYDKKTRLVYLPAAKEYDPPQSPNAAMAWARAAMELPECDLRRKAVKEALDFLKGMNQAFSQAFEKGIKKEKIQVSIQKESEKEVEPEYNPGSFEDLKNNPDNFSQHQTGIIIYMAWKEKLKPNDHGKTGAINQIVKNNENGYTVENMIKAFDNYRVQIVEENREEKFVKSCKGFYDSFWIDFIEKKKTVSDAFSAIKENIGKIVDLISKRIPITESALKTIFGEESPHIKAVHSLALNGKLQAITFAPESKMDALLREALNAAN